jgi:hypothetical protein
MLTLALGLAAAHTMLSAALSARAETQAAIDAVTLARPHVPINLLVEEPIEAKMAVAEVTEARVIEGWSGDQGHLRLASRQKGGKQGHRGEIAADESAFR